MRDEGLTQNYQEQNLYDGMEQLLSITNAAIDAIIIINEQGIITCWNPDAERIFGYTKQEVLGKDIRTLIIPQKYHEAHEKGLREFRETGQCPTIGKTIELSAIGKNGIEFPIELSLSALENNGRWYVLGIIRDITNRRGVAEALWRLQKAVETMHLGVTVTDTKGKILYTNHADATMHVYTVEELIGKDSRIFAPPQVRKFTAFEQMKAFKCWTRESVNMRKDGSIFPVRLVSDVVVDDEGIPIGVVTACEDITERKRAEETIMHMAYFDDLTGLPNRLLFNDRLTLSLYDAQRYKKLLAIIFLDLDRFKNINDTLGHPIGDLLLKAVAERLTGTLREADTVSRHSGDEFTILLPDINHAQDASKVALKIIKALSKVFIIEGHEIFITTSIGISLFPSDGDDVQTLLRNADIAMYAAKENGRNNYQFYTPAMNAAAFERMMLENSLRKAIEREEFFVHYQPKVNIKTGQIVGMEALVRWQHPDLGLVYPSQFISLTEETGLIVPIGELVLRTACRQNKEWQDAGFPRLCLGVNLSARQFQQQNLVGMVEEILNSTGLEPCWLELEITESTIMRDINHATHILRKLHKMGAQISIDDFGTGHSSLRYLKGFSVNTLKIDRSFLSDITTNPNDAAITNAIIAMGHSLKLKVIAEGVETEEQMAFLLLHQCDEIQGNLFSPPISAKEFTELLKKRQMERQAVLKSFLI